MQSSTNQSHDQNSHITGKIVGILHVLALKSAFEDLIGKHNQRVAAKFPSHGNWEFLEGKGRLICRHRPEGAPLGRSVLMAKSPAGQPVRWLFAPTHFTSSIATSSPPQFHPRSIWIASSLRADMISGNDAG